MDVKGYEYEITERRLERMAVTLTTVLMDGTRKDEVVRLDGNSGTTPYWGIQVAFDKLNAQLGYTEEFWLRPGYGVLDRKGFKKVNQTQAERKDQKVYDDEGGT